MTLDVTVTVTGVGIVDLDRTAQHDNRLRGRDGWDRETASMRALADEFTRAAGQALDECGAGPHRRREMEFATGTCYGTAQVAEVMHEQLRLAGPKWLDPEAFIFYSPHAPMSAAAMRHGVGGAACTVAGTDAGSQVLGHVVRRLRTGRAVSAIVGGYEALTPFAVAALDFTQHEGCDTRGEAVALVLDTQPERPGPVLSVRRRLADGAAVRAFVGDHLSGSVTAVWPVTAAVESVAALPAAETHRIRAAGPATAPLRALAEAVHRIRSGGSAVVLSGSPGAMDVFVVRS